MSVSKEQTVKQYNVDPSAVGLFGLAMVTLVSSSQRLGITEGTSLVIPWAIFLGAFAQLFACLEDNKRGNLFGTTAFAGYSLFWFGVGFSWLIQNGVFGSEMQQLADPKQLGIAFVGYFVFSIYMTIGALKTNKVLLIIFILIDILLLGLALCSFQIMLNVMQPLAAYSEFAIALVGFYGSAAHVINHQFGKVVLPLGKAIM